MSTKSKSQASAAAAAAPALSTEAEFRARHKISRTTLHRMGDEGPRWTFIGRRKYLTPAAELEWLASIDGRRIDISADNRAAA